MRYTKAMAEVRIPHDKDYLPSDVVDGGLLNKLRAAVLGANDGIVSTSAVVMGVAGATPDAKAITIAGLAALIAGALSMAVGEYVSVSSQSDAEKAYIEGEKADLSEMPEYELDELAREYQKHGVSRKTAQQVAKELTEQDALRAHLRMHFNIDPDHINSPWQAAIASLISFTVGGLVPFLTIVFTPEAWKVPATIAAVVVCLVATGYFSAQAGGASKLRAVIRVVVGGLLAMGITYGVGVLFGTAVA